MYKRRKSLSRDQRCVSVSPSASPPPSDLLLLYSHLKLRREAERGGKMERGPLALFNKQDLAIFLFPAASPNATLACDIAELVFRVAKKNGE